MTMSAPDQPFESVAKPASTPAPARSRERWASDVIVDLMHRY
jgi:hypothetical protein